MSTTHVEPTDEEQEVKRIEAGIAKTRSQMSSTLGALEQRLSPSELGEQARAQIDHLEERLKVVMKEGLQETKSILEGQLQAAKGAVHDEVLHAKGLVHEEIVVAKDAAQKQMHEAKELVTQTLAEAKGALKKDIETAIEHGKSSVRAATIGRVEDLATEAGDIMNATRETLIDTVRQNPIPAALAGIGIAWLLMNRSTTARHRGGRQAYNRGFDDHDRGFGPNEGYGFRSDGQGAGARMGSEPSHMDPLGAVSQVAGQARQAIGHAADVVSHGASDAAHQVESALTTAGSAVSGAAHDASDAVSQFAHRTSAAAGQFAHQTVDATGRVVHRAADAATHAAAEAQRAAENAAHVARDQAYRFERGVEKTYQENPLALGAVVALAGAAIGFALPRTEKEDALMGEVRDRLLLQASDKAHEAASSLHQLTDDAGKAAKQALSLVSA